MENDIIENFGDLPAEERARLVEEFEARLRESNKHKGREVEQLREINQQLRAHLARRQEFAQWLEQLVAEAERKDALLREEKQKILAAV